MEIPCRKCKSIDNGYYTPKSRTCKKCTNKKSNENRNRIARLQGYTGHYQKLKLKEYEVKEKTL
jgi:ribosomal protein S17E